MVRIAIVEDDAVLRQALGQMVAQVAGFALCGAGGTLAEGIALVNQQPDVLLLDLGLPDGSGLDLIAHAAAAAPDCRLLVLTVFADVRTVVAAIEAGADGSLLKESDVGQVAGAIETVLAGGAPISPAVASHILARVRGERPPTMAGGLSLKEVALRHGISHHAVGDHVKAIYRKLSVNSRSQAVHKAVRSGIIRIED